MTMDTAIHPAFLKKVAEAMPEMSSVPPAHARALILAAATFLQENGPRIEASPAELAQSAHLSDAECAEALDALILINAVMDMGHTDERSEELYLHPDLAWRGDPAERRRHSDLYPSLVLL